MGKLPFANADVDGAMAKSVASLSACVVPLCWIRSGGHNVERKFFSIFDPNEKTILRYFRVRKSQKSQNYAIFYSFL